MQKNIKKFDEGKGPERKKTYGRSKLNSNDKRCLSQLALIHPKWSSLQLANELLKRRDVKLHRVSVWRVLNKAGICKWKPSKSPDLTESHKQQRLNWCHENMQTDWSTVIFTDESYFQAFRNAILMWSRTKPTVSVPKYPPKVMVWGGLSLRGLTPIKIARGYVNSETYQNILQECLFESARELYPEGFILQQDNATPHTSKSTKDFLELHGIKVLKWPPNSPDLNPIENLWAIMKREVEKLDPTKINDVIHAVEKVWENVTIEVRESLINSMEKRVRLCIEAGGDKIDY